MTDHRTPFIPPQAATLLRADRKIEAIKLVLDANPGLGLRDAKNAVEHYQRQPAEGGQIHAAPDEAPSPPEGFPAQAELALRSGNKIEAVKIVRAVHRLDLRDALAVVDAHLRGQHADASTTGVGAGRADLPADVTMALLRGDRVGALELLEKTHGLANAEAIKRVLDHERQRSKRGLSGRADGTVRRDESNAGMLWWALLIAVAAVTLWYLVFRN